MIGNQTNANYSAGVVQGASNSLCVATDTYGTSQISSVGIGVKTLPTIGAWPSSNFTLTYQGSNSNRSSMSFQVTQPNTLSVLLLACGPGACDGSNGKITLPTGCVQRQLNDPYGFDTAYLATCASLPVGTYSFNAMSNSPYAAIKSAAYVFSNATATPGVVNLTIPSSPRGVSTSARPA